MPRKIAIVGGGPAGSAFAIALTNRGVDPGDLVVVDKARFPRPKLCGGAVTFRGTEVLRMLLGRELPGGAHTRAIQFRSSLGELEIVERGPQWLYDRALLDGALLDAVKARGVEVREGEEVRGMERTGEGWALSMSRAKESFTWVVGADGACGVSRRASRLRGGRTGRLVEAIYEPKGGAPDPSRLHFDFDPILAGIPGYAWLFPYPSPDGATNLWKIGIMDARGRVPGSALRRYTERFAERHGFRRVEDKIAGWPERYFDTRVRGHHRGLVLVGEAFGIDPLLGEGIAPALFHAQYAATRVKMALDAGTTRIADYEGGFLSTAEGSNLRFQMHLAELIYGPSGPRWLRVLFELPKLRALAGSGRETYGRLAKHMPQLLGSYVWHVLTRGLPSAEIPSCSIAR